MSASDLHESMKDPVIRGQYLSSIRNRGKDVLIADVTEAMDLLIEMAVKVQSAESRLHEVSVACATAERERDELRSSKDWYEEAAKGLNSRLLKAEAELSRRDAAAGEPVAWRYRATNMFGDFLDGWKFSETESLLGLYQPLYTAAPPAVLSQAIGEVRLGDYLDDGTRPATIVCLHDQAGWENFPDGTKLYLSDHSLKLGDFDAISYSRKD